MTFIPTGFTAIIDQFIQYVNPPSVYGSIQKNSTFFSGDLSSFTSDEVSLSTISNSIIEIPNSARLTMSAAPQSASQSIPVNFNVQLSFDDDTIDKTGFVVVLALIGTTSVGIQTIQPRAVVTNEFGRAVFVGLFSNESNRFTNVKVQAWLEARTDIKTTQVTVKVAPNTNNATFKVPVINGLSKVSQQESGFAALSDSFEQISILEELNLLPIQDIETGSSGDGAYNQSGILSPGTTNPDGDFGWAIQAIQGFATDQSRRHKSWSKDILHDVHSPMSESENSEVKVLGNIAPAQVGECLTSYGDLIAQSGKFSAAANSSYLPDYAEGHQVKKTNAHEQFVCDQFRVQASSVFNINAASINVISQQQLTESRYLHSVSDINHNTCQHYWVRAESQHTLMTKCAVTYADDANVTFTPYRDDFVGSRFRYADDEFIQIGNDNDTTLHKTKSSDRYGYGTRGVYAKNGMSYVVGDGDFNVQAEAAVNIRAETGGLYMYTKEGLIEINSQDLLTLYGKEIAYLNSKILNIKADEILNLDAPIMNVNSGLAQIPILFSVPKLTAMTLDIDQMESPPDLPKETASEYSVRSQTTPKNPTPYASLAGPKSDVQSSQTPTDQVNPSNLNTQ